MATTLTTITAHDLNTELQRVGARPCQPGGVQAFVNGPTTILTDGELHRWAGTARMAFATLQALPSHAGSAGVWQALLASAHN